MRLASSLLLAVALVAPASATERAVTVFGHEIRYGERGAGPAVVLLHGLGFDRGHWDQNVEPLAAGHRVLVPDQIGFGESAKPLIAYDTYVLVDYLGGFLDALAIERATLVGHSLGARVALNFALRQPQRVQSLVLVSSSGITLLPPSDRARATSMNPRSLEEMRELLLMLNSDSPRVTEDYVRQAWSDRLRHGDAYTIDRILAEEYAVVDEKLPAIQAPTLVVWGRRDLLRPCCGLGQRLALGVPNGKLVLLDTGHNPHFEDPEGFNRLLVDWLGRPHSNRSIVLGGSSGQ